MLAWQDSIRFRAPSPAIRVLSRPPTQFPKEGKSLMKWVKDHAIEIITLLVSVASAITSIATGLGNVFRTEPLALTAWTVFLLVIGISAGWFLRRIITVISNSSLQLLNGRRAVEYLENQPETFKEIIRDAYENGGVCYALSLDSDMRILASRGFFEAPDFQDAIFECTWALKPKAIALIEKHPECLMMSRKDAVNQSKE